MAEVNPKIIVALDYSRSADALAFADRVDPKLCRLKVGKELFTIAGPDVVRELVKRDFDVFLDLKFHDIPNTVARACAAAADLGVWMINVHGLGGAPMLQAAREALGESQRPLLIAVTILTSMDAASLHDVGLSGEVEENVLRLARLTQAAGLDGVVCSPLEIAALRQNLSAQFQLITPGIRPAPSQDDQKRTLGPAQAIALGADYLVIGRPITQAPDSLVALQDIVAQICN